jgi:hypothetical protein
MEDMEKDMNKTNTTPVEAKKPYTRPNLTVHGSVEDITQFFAHVGPFKPPIRTFS